MRPVITPAESARLDAASTVPEAVLLERAGLAVSIAAARMGAGYGTRVVVLAGTGNNGGDGWVAARLLRRRGADVVVRCLGYPRGDSSPRRAAAIAAMRSGIAAAPIGAALEPADLIVDAVFGAGFHGELPAGVAAWTGHSAPVLAVDFPSGLDGLTGSAEGPVFRATRTVTFHALKTGHLVGIGPEVCGEVEVADIGLAGGDPEWMLCEDGDAVVPTRARDAHKWSAGSVLVIGGSAGMAGAPVLAARAAVAFGAGMVRVAVPGGVAATTAAMDPGLVTVGIGAGDRFAVDDATTIDVDRCDAIVLGPGLGAADGEFVARLLARWEGPVVLDADGLGAVTPDHLARRTAPTVITPHAGEFARLAGEPASAGAAATLAERTGAVVLRKGSPTFVMGRERWVVTSGSADLATMGTGDVLAGMIAALIARGMAPEAAARAAAHRHGQAGRRRAAVTSVTASGLIDEIGRLAW